MIHVDIYNECTGSGGTERYVANLVERLDRSSFHPVLLVPDLRPEEHSDFIARFQELDVGVEMVRYPVHLSTVRRIAYFSRFFRNRARTLGRDRVLHVNSFAPTANAIEIVGAKLGGIPHILSTNHLPTLGFQGLNFIGRSLGRVAYRAIDKVVVESERNRDLAISHCSLPPGKVHVIEYGIDIEQIALRSATKANRTTSKVAVGCVGRLVEQKGHRYLIEAISMLVRHGVPPLELLIAGEGPLRAELESQAERLGVGDAITFMGHQENIYEFLGAIDIFAMPSEFEGLPFALLEAMAAKKPIVAADVDGVQDAIMDGRNGLLVTPRDAAALAAALRSLIADRSKWRYLGDEASSTVKGRFGIDRMARETEALYRSVVTDR